jgi:hypothetical protein
MSIIIDKNVAASVLVHHDNEEYALLRSAIWGQKKPIPRLVYGGKLTVEYRGSPNIYRVVLQLDRAGRAYTKPDAEVDAEQEVVIQCGLCRSDDQHIIALARVSGARLLCSDDGALRDDFRDKRLINEPRGNLYSSSHHRALLLKHCSEK